MRKEKTGWKGDQNGEKNRENIENIGMLFVLSTTYIGTVRYNGVKLIYVCS